MSNRTSGDAQRRGRPLDNPNRLVARFALTFLTLVLLFSILVRVDIALLQGVTTAWVTRHSAQVVTLVLRLAGADVAGDGNMVQLGSAAFEVVSNCTGIEVIGLFVAAVLAFPSSWRHRLTGLAWGIPVLIALNVVRMLTLIYLGARAPEALQYAHLYVWPVLVLTAALGMWLHWATLADRDQRLVA